MNELQTYNSSLMVKDLEDSVIIESSKNIIFRSDKNIIIQSNGYNIIMGKEIHLNPNININTIDIDEMVKNIDSSKQIQTPKYKHHYRFTCIFKKIKLFFKGLIKKW